LTKVLLVAALSCLGWTQAVENTPFDSARGGAADVAQDRSKVRVSTAALSGADAARELLPAPGVAARAGVASPTRAPWVVANGWRFTRQPAGKFRYDLPAGKGTLAAAEAFAYGADAVLKIDPADAAGVAAMMTALETLPAANLPPIADVGVVDDDSPITGEVMNLLARRNLLYQVVRAPSPRLRLNIVMGSREYPVADAADPSAFALKIRRQLTGEAGRVRLHLINYGGREIEGLRVRVRGAYGAGDAWVAAAGRVSLLDHVAADGATELSLPRMGTYAVVDLTASR
jgi:hypothetical protein